MALYGFRNKKTSGRVLMIAGVLILLVFGYPWLPRFALGRLESRQPAVVEVGSLSQKSEAGGRRADDEAPRFIMVLSASRLSADTNRTAGARFSDESLQRIVEG